MESTSKPPKFQLEKTLSGATTIRDLSIGEKLHPAGPVFESESTYVKQSGLRERLLRLKPVPMSPYVTPLVVYDVGLGAAGNASAAFRLWKKLSEENVNGETIVRPLHIVSFENEIEVLKFAVENISEFPHLLPVQSFLEQFISGVDHPEKMPGDMMVIEVSGGDFTWTLFFGDFHEFFISPDQKKDPAIEDSAPPVPLAEIIFHDPYSPVSNPRMWDLKTFNILRNNSAIDCVMTTYSQSTHVRAAMLVAGFHVGHGDELGINRESTFASRDFDLVLKPLGPEFLERWKRSTKGFPSDINEVEARERFQTNLELALSKLALPR